LVDGVVTVYPPVSEHGESEASSQIVDTASHSFNIHSYYSSQPAANSFVYSAAVSDEPYFFLYAVTGHHFICIERCCIVLRKHADPLVLLLIETERKI